MTQAQLKKEVKKKIGEICNPVYTELCKMDKAELETALEVINGYTQTNCGWIEYNMAPSLRELIRCRLHDITPVSQQPLPTPPTQK